MTGTTKFEAFFKLDTGTHTDDIRQLALSADGRTLVSAGECTIRVWDAQTRQLRRLLLGPIARREQERYGDGNVERFALSPDGRWLVALKSWGPKTAGIDAEPSTAVEVFELATSNLQARFRHPGLLLDVDFSPDGRCVVIAGNRCDGAVRRAVVHVYATRDLVRGGFARAPRRLASRAFAEGARKDEMRVAARFVPGAAKRAAACRLVVACQGTSPSRSKSEPGLRPGALAWCSVSAAGRLRVERSITTATAIAPKTLAASAAFVAVAADDGIRRTQNFGQFYGHDHEGRLVSTTLTESSPAAIAFSRDGSRLLVGLMSDARRGGPSVLPSAYGSGHATPQAEGDAAPAPIEMPLGLPPVAGDQTVQVNAYATALGHFELRCSHYGHDDSVGALAWLDDGTAVSSGGDNQAIHFWSTQHRVGELRAAIRGVGQTFHSPGIDGSERVFFGTVPERLLPPNHARRQQSFDLRTMTLTTTCPSDIDESDFETGKWSILALDPVRTIPLRHKPSMDMAAPPDLTLFVGSDDEWVIWSRSGYYDTSPNGAQRVGYHVNRGADREALFFPSDRFKPFYQPELIRAIVEHGSEENARARGYPIPPVDVASALPPIVELAPRGVVTGPDHVTLRFTVEALTPDRPVTRIWILRNERFVWSQTKPSRKACADYKVKLRMGPGRNVFSIRAETADARSVPVVQEVIGAGLPLATPLEATASGNLYLLSVGVSEFAAAGTPEAGKLKPLVAAHKDAIAIVNAFGKSKRSNVIDKRSRLRNRAFDAVEASLLLNEAATKAAILRELERLCSRIAERARSEGAERDVLMVFLSGHGVRLVGGTELYFWNHDLKPTRAAVAETGLSMVELGELITSVSAEVVLIIDACHAGLAGSNVMSGLDPEELARRIHAVNERGMYVLNAARSEELAREDKAAGQGIFTAALLGALASRRHFVPEAPRSRLRAISMLGLIAGIQELVPQISARAGTHAQTPVCRMYGDLLPLTIYKA